MPGAVGAPSKVPSGLRETPGGRVPDSTAKTSGSLFGSTASTGSGAVPSGTVCASFSGSAVKAGGAFSGAAVVTVTVVLAVPPRPSVIV